ncbi:TIGR04376 family protein [Leptolyngbya cf. ectocarpi LEGE 11479]|uniref:TIGR04376 family protein n=1 Tax=Leptolyngbya cf. ectocarpi LEGE 11479 TaxID=1828722 RepID=A0A928X3H5_LEPEC|nr:TIGR04376 family protein [Leptolyngbya ectocarpi]MBE9066919.1 TIGR04376 family protein [Leptolyngbya cf. ectocarpi LEGE 11479]
MSIFDDFSQFLETRLDEFLKAHPHLEMMALEEQLRGQEEDAIATLANLKRREAELETAVLDTARDIKRWHERIAKAESANRPDLVKPAKEREATLLRQGNHLWGQMKSVKARLTETQALQQRIHTKRQELKAKIASAQTATQAPPRDSSTTGWHRSPFQSQSLDPLEESFQRWETEAELEELKRQMGK